MLLRELPIFFRHGRQFVPDLRRGTLPETFPGRPVISPDITPEETLIVAKLCPVQAIGMAPCSIDLGKCVFCKECAFVLPGKISFTNDFRIAVNNREKMIIRQGVDEPVRLDPEKIRKEIRSIFRHALKLRQVSAGGDNSAEMEMNATGNVNFDMGRYGIEFVASPRHADGLVITGPISGNMAEALQICYDAIPGPKLVIVAGTDAISGGIFQNGEALDRSFLSRYPIDLFVPGNPPHPLTFINGILDLTGRK
ncbi:MAG: NADH:ubiquinone oxidoreductase [Bacteroidales bacterium]|jgi:Ni,Fe-hydrogenase III small subunit|nr:NADH:ubiquinone oxidoreductase [Bacteroidales bacterium]